MLETSLNLFTLDVTKVMGLVIITLSVIVRVKIFTEAEFFFLLIIEDLNHAR